MNGNDIKHTDEKGNSKSKSDTTQSRWKLERGKKGFNSCAELQMQ